MVLRYLLVSVLVMAFLSFSCSRIRHQTPDPETGSPASVEEEGAPLQEIMVVLQADTTDQARLAVFDRFVKVGMSKDDVDRALGGPCCYLVHGPGFEIADYGEIGKNGVVVYFYPDGEAYAIGYRKNTQSVILRSDEPVTWPKTKNELYERLRQKKGQS